MFPDSTEVTFIFSDDTVLNKMCPNFTISGAQHTESGTVFGTVECVLHSSVVTHIFEGHGELKYFIVPSANNKRCAFHITGVIYREWMFNHQTHNIDFVKIQFGYDSVNYDYSDIPQSVRDAIVDIFKE